MTSAPCSISRTTFTCSTSACSSPVVRRRRSVKTPGFAPPTSATKTWPSAASTSDRTTALVRPQIRTTRQRPVRSLTWSRNARHERCRARGRRPLRQLWTLPSTVRGRHLRGRRQGSGDLGAQRCRQEHLWSCGFRARARGSRSRSLRRRRDHRQSSPPDSQGRPDLHPRGTGDLSRAVGHRQSQDGNPAGGRPHRAPRGHRSCHYAVPGARRQQRAGSLSGGEQQMLALARALAVEPKLIIADEMSLGLAPLMVDQVFESLERVRADGITIILIEQFIHRALAFADDCVILTRGTVGWRGPASAAGTEVLEQYLGEASAVPPDSPNGSQPVAKEGSLG